MPLLSPARELIEIAITNVVSGTTEYRRKARFLSLRHTQSDSGECEATIQVRVFAYAAAGDDFGPLLLGFTPYDVALEANNQTVVDLTTSNEGAILAIRRADERDEQWLERCEEFAQPTMLQGDFFHHLREQQQVNIGDMIRHHIQQADAMGRFL